jgi:hypothetical protein
MFEEIFRPTDSLQYDIDEFKRNYFGKYTVGIQVRTWSRNVAGADALRNPTVPIDVFLQVLYYRISV